MSIAQRCTSPPPLCSHVLSNLHRADFGLPPDVVAASLGNLGVEEVVSIEAMLPDNFAIGRDECLSRCGLTRGPQPTTQRQPRVSGNALPSGSASSAAATASVQKRDAYVPVQIRKRD